MTSQDERRYDYDTGLCRLSDLEHALFADSTGMRTLCGATAAKRFPGWFGGQMACLRCRRSIKIRGRIT